MSALTPAQRNHNATWTLLTPGRVEKKCKKMMMSVGFEPTRAKPMRMLLDRGKLV
jgi:hypothetical protein